MILKETIGKFRHAHVVMLHFQGKKNKKREISTGNSWAQKH